MPKTSFLNDLLSPFRRKQTTPDEQGSSPPALVVTPHQDAARAAYETAQIGNREEVNGQ